MSNLRYILILFCFYFFSCASPVDYVKTGEEYTPLSKDAEVKVFLVKKPERAYDEIGIIEVHGQSLEYTLETAKEKAREVGGNALIRYQSIDVKFYIIRLK